MYQNQYYKPVIIAIILIIAAMTPLLFTSQKKAVKQSLFKCTLNDGTYVFYDAEMLPEKACEDKQNDFFGNPSPDKYQKCLQNYEDAKQLSQEQQCDPIGTEIFTEGTSQCTVYYEMETKDLYSSKCTGENDEIQKIQEKAYKKYPLTIRF